MSTNDSYRLVVHQRTNLDLIRESIPKPPGAIPKNSLPTWETMMLEQKIPLVPAPKGSLYYSRAKLGESLLRTRKAGGFTIMDPHNQERIPSNKYEVLHDRNSMLQNNVQVQKAIKDFGMLNDDGEVICTITEFNRYRKYLATLHNDEINARLAELDKLAAVQIQIDRTVRYKEQYKQQIALRIERTEKVRKFKEEQKTYSGKSFNQRQQLAEALKAEHEERHREQQAIKTLQWEQQKQLAQQRILDREEREKERQKQMLMAATLKEMNSVAYKENFEEEKKIEKQNKALNIILNDWFTAKIRSTAERVERERYIQDAYSSELKQKAVSRQRRVERLRDEIPMRIEQKKAEARRLDAIVRKYAMRWLNHVRERLAKAHSEHEKHHSLWYSGKKDSLKECTKHLYKQSGYEKLDDIVMNILKFKEALKKQMLLEEGMEWEDEE